MAEAQRVRIVGTKPRQVRITDRPARRISPEEFGKAICAVPVAYYDPKKLDPISLAEIGTQLLKRLQSSGGRPALADTTYNCRVPMTDEDVKLLEHARTQMQQTTGSNPSLGQTASILLHQYLHSMKRT